MALTAAFNIIMGTGPPKREGMFSTLAFLPVQEASTVAKPELGTKRICPETGRKFYDLMKDPIVSPYTGTTYPISFFEETAKIAVIEKEEEEEKEEVAEVEEESADVEIVSLEEADDETKTKSKADDLPDDDDDVEIDDDDDDTFLADDDDDDDDDVSDIIGVSDDDDD